MLRDRDALLAPALPADLAEAQSQRDESLLPSAQEAGELRPGVDPIEAAQLSS
ncbi:hypothetical protein [Streptomyces sp. NPDC018321]|uniref:hypothetical protein n=1 Tax=Streptomyces sp. NPDC018321 TaxID=3365043 RepID=UPI0037BAEFBB